MMLFRPTVLQIACFLLSDAPRRRSSSVSSDSETHAPSESALKLQTFAYICKLIHRLLHRRKREIDWLRRDLELSTVLRSVSILCRTDEGDIVAFAGIRGVELKLGICPALVSLEGSLEDIWLLDCSSRCGLYDSVLRITDASHDQFIRFSVTVYSNTAYPAYPGYPFFADCSVHAPCITLCRRFIEEMLFYVIDGPLWDAFTMIMRACERPAGDNRIRQAMVSSALMLGKSLIAEKATGVSLPVVLPCLHVFVTDLTVRIPESSSSSSMMVCEFGRLRVENSEPTERILTDDGVLSSLNTVDVRLENVCIHTELPGGSQTLMGKTSLYATVNLSHRLEANVRLSKLVATVSESQIQFLLHMTTGNLGERASVIPREGLSRLHSIPTQPVTKRTKNALSFTEEMSFAVTLDGFIAEYLHGCGGYPGTISGDALCQSIGTQKVIVVSGFDD